MTLTELFRINPNIIINTDIDGILCGVILSRYCGCRVAGFSNSDNRVWLRDGIDSVYEPVYIDMFVPRADVWCIDQHIVSLNDHHHDLFVAAGTKFNPQLDRHRIFIPHDYTYKYPFGCVHYIIAMLEHEGIRIDYPDLQTVVDQEFGIRLGDLLLRADDALKTTLNSNYMPNARDWWGWLMDLSGNAASVQRMRDFLYRDTPANRADDIKLNTKRYLNTHFQSRTSDGGFSNIIDENGIILPNISLYINEIARLMGMPIEFEQHYTPHYGTATQRYWNQQWDDEFVNHGTINGEPVFSYAFIYSPNGRRPNFSYTVNME